MIGITLSLSLLSLIVLVWFITSYRLGFILLRLLLSLFLVAVVVVVVHESRV